MGAIEQWFDVFTHPAQLSKQIAKKWIFHGTEIKADIASEQSDWAAGHYFSAGEDIADIFYILLGPVYPETEQVSVDANGLSGAETAIEFVAGMVEGLIQENHLDDIQYCVKDADMLVEDVEELYNDVTGKHLIKAARTVAKIKGELPMMLSECKSMGPQLKALEKWSTEFMHPADVSEKIGKSLISHN